MIEATVIQYLNNNLSHPAYAMRPKKKPTKYYLVELVGGNMTHTLHHSTIAIKSIVSNARDPGTTLLDAAEMNEQLLKTMINDDGGLLVCPDVAKVELNSSYNNTDPEADEYEYQAVFDINHY